jgi:hypothetical protein
MNFYVSELLRTERAYASIARQHHHNADLLAIRPVLHVLV